LDTVQNPISRTGPFSRRYSRQYEQEGPTAEGRPPLDLVDTVSVAPGLSVDSLRLIGVFLGNQQFVDRLAPNLGGVVAEQFLEGAFTDRTTGSRSTNSASMTASGSPSNSRAKSDRPATGGASVPKAGPSVPGSSTAALTTQSATVSPSSAEGARYSVAPARVALVARRGRPSGSQTTTGTPASAAEVMAAAGASHASHSTRRQSTDATAGSPPTARGAHRSSAARRSAAALPWCPT